MIRVTSINQKISIDDGGVAADASVNVLIAVRNQEGAAEVSKARFRLTPEEEESLAELCAMIENRLGLVLVADVGPLAATDQKEKIPEPSAPSIPRVGIVDDVGLGTPHRLDSVTSVNS